MEKERRNLLYLLAGRKFTGKTTIGMAIAIASGKKICVVDTDEHPAYADFKKVDVRDLHKWKTGNVKCICDDPEEALTILNKHCANAFIIAEDAAKYVSANVQQPIRRFIIDHRKRNFDVIFMFHFLADIPPYIAKQYDHMVLFKTGDSLEAPQHKFANWHTIVPKLRRILDNKDMHYCESIRIDE
jgi:archaeosine-15-forming tRNA-guanine transglycosylase